MKIDTTIVVCDPLDDTPFKRDDNPDSKDVTLGWVIARALFDVAFDPTDKNMGSKKFDRFTLASEIGKATGEVEVTPEQLTDIRACVDRRWPTVVCGQVWPHLSGSVKEKEE